MKNVIALLMIAVAAPALAQTAAPVRPAPAGRAGGVQIAAAVFVYPPWAPPLSLDKRYAWSIDVVTRDAQGVRRSGYGPAAPVPTTTTTR